MSDRDRLIELFKKIEYTPFPEMTMKSNLGNQFTDYALNCIVDDLLANGVGFKAKAYKEFTENAVERVEKARQKYERLCKEQGEQMEEYMHIHFDGIIGIINNLLKEKVGANSETTCKSCEHETDDSGYCLDCYQGIKHTKLKDMVGDNN